MVTFYLKCKEQLDKDLYYYVVILVFVCND